MAIELKPHKSHRSQEKKKQNRGEVNVNTDCSVFLLMYHKAPTQLKP